MPSFATTLAAAVGASQPEIELADAGATVGAYLQIGEEIVVVESVPDNTNPIATAKQLVQVQRGAFGSIKAAHDDEADVTEVVVTVQTGDPVVPPAESPGSSGLTVDNQSDPPAVVTTLVAPGAVIVGDEATLAAGSEQTVRLLGPFDVDFDAVGGYAVLATLAAGDLVVTAWPEIITPFDGGATVIELYVGPELETWLLMGQFYPDSASGSIAEAQASATVNDGWDCRLPCFSYLPSHSDHSSDLADRGL